MATVDWKKAFLKDNPFLGTPPSAGEEIIWAGMSNERKHLEERIQHSLSTSPYSLILNWGPWGGGKTHAARFFNQETVLLSLSRRAKVPHPLSLIINIPRGGTKNVVNDLYINIISAIGLQRLRKDLSGVATTLGPELGNVIRAHAGDEELAAALIKLAETTDEVPLVLKRYFLLSAGTTELRELGLARTIQTNTDMIKIITSIFNLLLNVNGHNPVYSEIIIWFDEMEEIISLPGREQVVLTGLLRDLTDYVPRNLTMFLNFTTRPGGKYEDIGAYLTPAVWDRVRDQVFFGYFDKEQIKEYILGLINSVQHRSKDVTGLPSKYFPFDENAFDYLSEVMMAKATPRAINEVCSLVIERALSSGTLDQEGSVIDSDFIKSLDYELKLITSRGTISGR